MEKTNAVKLAADLVERLEKLYVEPSAAAFREFFGKPYAGFAMGSEAFSVHSGACALFPMAKMPWT